MKISKIKCSNCNDIIQSFHLHDYKKCKCGACFIDGGSEYTRVGGNLEDILVICPDNTERSLRIFQKENKD